MTLPDKVKHNRLNNRGAHRCKDQREWQCANDHRDPNGLDPAKDQHRAHHKGQRRAPEHNVIAARPLVIARAVDRVDDQDCAVGGW